jgi:hypothetical protein
MKMNEVQRKNLDAMLKLRASNPSVEELDDEVVVNGRVYPFSFFDHDPTANRHADPHRLAKSYQGNAHLLPKILTTDVMARWHDFQVGDIVEIETHDGIEHAVIIPG